MDQPGIKKKWTVKKNNVQWSFIDLKQRPMKRQNLPYGLHRDLSTLTLAQQLKQSSEESGVKLTLQENFEYVKQFKHVKAVFASLTHKTLKQLLTTGMC